MFLCEEYIKRHNIKIPYVKHVNWGSLFLQNSQDQWRLMTISWKEPQNHPGYYIVRAIKPIHDGWISEKFFDKMDEQTIHLDEYEDFVINTIKSVKKVPNERIGVLSAAWETSLYIFDSLVAKYATSYLCNNLFIEGSYEELLAFDDFVRWLGDKVPQFGNFWHSDMTRYIDCHLDWLSDMIREREKYFGTSQS